MKQILFLLAFSLNHLVFSQDTVFSLKMKLTGHTKTVEVVQYSPDGKWLASGGYDGNLKIYKADTPGIGNLHKSLTGHMGCITAIAFNTDGSQVASGSKDNSVRIYNTATGELIFSSTEHSGAVSHITFDSKGDFLLSSSADGKINLYDIKNPTKKASSVNYGGPINSFIVAPNGKSIYVASGKTSLEQINFKGVVVASLAGHNAKINCMELSPDKKTIATGSDDKNIIIWDVATGKSVKTFTGHAWKVTSVCFSSDGRYLVSTCNDGVSIVWDVESNARSCSIIPNSTKIAVATIMDATNHGAVVYNTPLKKAEPVVVKPKTGTTKTVKSN
jgi:WD40 repeat protein